jgi:hypothetical protein
MSSIELTLPLLKAIGVLAETMTPEQCRAAAGRLRVLEGDVAESRFFEGMAAGLEQFADAAEQER